MSTHLFIRSSYTLLSSTVRIKELVQKAVHEGYEHIALTDHNVMFGMASFLDECRKANIHGIIGLEVDCLYHDEKIPFLLLAKDNQGYLDLMHLSSLICTEKRPCTAEELIDASRHCFLIVYGEGGWFSSAFSKEDYDRVIEQLDQMRRELPIFDVALSFQESAYWKTRNARLKRICTSLNIKTAALNKIYYLEEKDAEALRLLECIDQKKTVMDPTANVQKGRYFLSKEEMSSLYDAEDLERTDEIAMQCKADGILPKTSLPVFACKEGMSSKQYLPLLAKAGLKKRLAGKEDPVYTKRLEYELSVIEKMHFEDYFLIVYDFIRYAKTNGIYVGPGRGSAAGSLCAYCLGITMIDPMEYDLLFERFLNPERVSMPDIDTDIPDDKRDEVLQYVYNTYGPEHVAKIVTFGTLSARQCIRDVAKAMNLDPMSIDAFSKLIPERPIGNMKRVTLQSAYETSPRLRNYILADERREKIFAMAKRVEGLPRHTSLHAAGIIMSSLPLQSVIPTMAGDDAFTVSQYEEAYLEEKGLIKMDFLGLRNLSIIDRIVTEIKKEEPAFSLTQISTDDDQTMHVFQRVDTIGIFQFESRGMQKLLRQMNPRNFNDIVAANALYRPGPMKNINLYLENRNHPEKIVYPSKDLEPILIETYGVMVYQEQTMLVAQKAAGFSLGKADIMRRAISKKNMSLMEKIKTAFMSGCMKNGYSQEVSASLYALIEQFAGYGFNKSHAVAYSTIAWQMAYFKANYPLYFYQSLLNSVIGDREKTAQYISECRSREISITYPNVNRSSEYYAHTDTEIILPLSAAKDCSMTAAHEIAEEREKNGPYKDLFDFTARAIMHKISKNMIVSLIDAGALDSLGDTRKTCKMTLDEAYSYGELIQPHDAGQTSLDLNLVSKAVYTKYADNMQNRMENEINALGFTLAPNPLRMIKEKLGIHDQTIASILESNGTVTGFAEILSVKNHRVKSNGKEMAFLNLQDETGKAEMTVFPKEYEKYKSGLCKGAYIRFEAKAKGREDLICTKVGFIKKK